MINGHPIALAARTFAGLSPIEVIDLAAETGFDAIGLLVEPDQWSARRTAEVRRRADAQGVALLDVEVVRIHSVPFDASLPRLLRVAQDLGAGHVLTVGHDGDLARVAAAFRSLCEQAHSHHLGAALEFMAFRGVASLRDALHVVEEAGHPAGTILIDNHHLARSGGTVADVAAVPAGLIRYVQLCDAPQEPLGGYGCDALLQDALESRRLPGEGALPLRPFVQALPAGTPISIEIIGDAARRRFPTPQAYARAIMQAVQRTFDQAGPARNAPLLQP